MLHGCLFCEYDVLILQGFCGFESLLKLMAEAYLACGVLFLMCINLLLVLLLPRIDVVSVLFSFVC